MDVNIAAALTNVINLVGLPIYKTHVRKHAGPLKAVVYDLSACRI